MTINNVVQGYLQSWENLLANMLNRHEVSPNEVSLLESKYLFPVVEMVNLTFNENLKELTVNLFNLTFNSL